jgi:hypothetical protein
VIALVTSLVAFACMFGGMLLGILVRPMLPDHHLNAESKDVLKLGIGMLATLTALVLGLLTASAQSTYDTAGNELLQISSKAILLDRTMAAYGPETRDARDLLRRGLASTIELIWPEETTGPTAAEAPGSIASPESIRDNLLRLSPRSDAQRWLQSRALQINGDVAGTRWLLKEQQGSDSLPRPFLVMLVCWVTIIFFCFSILSSRNATVVIVLLICALSVASSLYLLQELGSPSNGLIKISSSPLRNALVELGR